VIREAKIDDLETLHKIELECFGHEAFPKSWFEYFLKTPRFLNLVALVKGEIAGFIIGSIERYGNKTHGHIYSLDVSLGYRRRGVAYRLLNKAEEILIESGAEACHLEVRTDNIPALRLYKKRGYTITETLKNYYRTGVNGFRLSKNLSDQQARHPLRSRLANNTQSKRLYG